MTRTITTPEELDALPVGSVILDNAGIALQKRVTGWWTTTGMRSLSTRDISGEALPATVLHDSAVTEREVAP